MSLLLLFRPRSGATSTADTHDGGGHYLQDYRILTESEWRERFGGKKKAIELQPVERVEAKPSPVKPAQGIGLSELEEARARYLYAQYKVTSAQEKIDELNKLLAMQELYSQAVERAKNREIQAAIDRMVIRLEAEEAERVRLMAVLEELDSADTMLMLMLH